MTILHTTNYGIAYCDDQTQLKDVAAVTAEAAQTIDAALGRGGIAPPDATTQAQLAARATSLENSRTADEGRLTTLESRATALEVRARCTVTGSPPVASGTALLTMVWSAKSSRSTTSMWAAANPTLIKVPLAGEYDISVNLPWPGNVTGLRTVAWRVNGGAWTYFDVRANPNSTIVTNDQSAIYMGADLPANGNVEIGVWQNSGVSLTLTGARCTVALAK